ncbi:ABC transporter permease [Caldifermentibacillus hisashii]|uniref:ABC transporter permease n=1 Tax=Caldifermentibacillus hisashii TaxID=996558 RepID=UPI002DFD45E0|nr:ABC transporter permease [Caldifermentibacillus hisashii]
MIQATVISLVISIVLFLSVSYFTKTMQESFSMTQDGPDYDMSVLFNGHYGSEAKQAFEKITELDGVTERIIMQDFTFVSQIDEAKVPDSVRNYVIHSENGKIKFQVILHALDQSSLQAYAEQIRVNDDLLNQENKFPAIVINKNNYQDIEKKQYVKEKAVNVEVGDLLDLQYEDLDTGKIKDVNKVEIVALTDKQPMGLRKMISPGEIHVVVSEDTLNKLLAEHQNISDKSYYYLYLKSRDPIKTEKQIDEMNLSTQPSIYNVYHSRIQDEQMSRIIQVFVYGFVLLISAVSVANIFNTISTSIALRKREFAMLKSVGMTPKGFNKMLNYESIFYGMKALLYGLPISLVIMYLMYRSFSNSFAYRFNLPWVSLLVTILGVFIIVGVTMLYSSSKVKKENIIDALKQENI